MQIGVGLPAMVPGVSPDRLFDWAVQAELSGFASLGSLDRIVFDNYEPLIALAGAAALTTRIRLRTTVLLGATRGNGALLAKHTASLHRLSAGRLELGLAAGGREDDFHAVGAPYQQRGRDLDRLLVTLRSTWAGQGAPGSGPIGPALPEGAPPLHIGGHSEAAARRTAAHADGWIAGTGSAEPFGARLDRVLQAWDRAGRAGRPYVTALAYFSLGPNAAHAAENYFAACYGGLNGYTRRLLAEVLDCPQAVSAAVETYAGSGCDELILLPCSADERQLPLLVRALGDRLKEHS